MDQNYAWFTVVLLPAMFNECGGRKLRRACWGRNSCLSRRLSRGLGSLRNDLRQNIAFTTYNTLKLVMERRNLKPLRKSPSIDSNPPGLDWLSSMETALIDTGCRLDTLHDLRVLANVQSNHRKAIVRRDHLLSLGILHQLRRTARQQLDSV